MKFLDYISLHIINSSMLISKLKCCNIIDSKTYVVFIKGLIYNIRLTQERNSSTLFSKIVGEFFSVLSLDMKMIRWIRHRPAYNRLVMSVIHSDMILHQSRAACLSLSLSIDLYLATYAPKLFLKVS